MQDDLSAVLPQWIATLVAAAIAVAVVVIVFHLLRKALLRVTQSRPIAKTVIEKTASPARWLAALLAVQTVWEAAPDTLYLIEIVRHITTLAIIGVLTWMLVRAIGAASQVITLKFPVDTADNLHARRVLTQARVMTRILISLAVIFGVAAALMTFPSVRQIGASLLASAGLVGLVVGFAAKSVLANILAGLQIALTQPIRLDDVVVVEGEWGKIEEITGAFVLVRLWDERCLVVPLQWFIEHPFQNWTRTASQIMGSVFLWVDYRIPVEALRSELKRICENAPDWDRRVCNMQVTDANDKAMQLRALVSSADASRNWDLRCLVRERLILFIQRAYPQYLPKMSANAAEVATEGEVQSPAAKNSNSEVLRAEE